MRTLYLIRHGRVAFPEGRKRCIGRTDLSLDYEGRLQAEKLGIYFQNHPVEAVFCSPLIRSKETAAILSGGRLPVYVSRELTELDMGEWENVPFERLKAVRTSLEQEPEHGEGRTAGKKRMDHAICGILEKTKGDVAVVSHAGVNCCFLSGILNSSLERSRAITQPYGGISKILVDESGNFSLKELGRRPEHAPDEEECEILWRRYETPEWVRQHCRAVAGKVRQMEKTVREARLAEYALDWRLAYRAALLHDLVRTRKHHAALGKEILLKEGYPRTAEIIGCHHWLEREIFDEAAVVYLADKYICGEKEVSLEERFQASLPKCLGCREAMENHALRYEQAKRAEGMYHRILEAGAGGNCLDFTGYAIHDTLNSYYRS